MRNFAAATSSSPEPDQLVRVQGDDQTYEFNGELIATATTHRPDKPRWLDMELWRVTDGTGRYVIGRIGKSLVYHKHDGPCGRGVPTPAMELNFNAIPCADCGAPSLNIARSIPGRLVMREAEHPSASVCQDAHEVLQALRLPDIGYSAPAQRLLDTARLRDEKINAAMSVIKRL
jgi:hypothetical protein